jgi:hypothetical protein
VGALAQDRAAPALTAIEDGKGGAAVGGCEASQEGFIRLTGGPYRAGQPRLDPTDREPLQQALVQLGAR